MIFPLDFMSVQADHGILIQINIADKGDVAGEHIIAGRQRRCIVRA